MENSHQNLKDSSGIPRYVDHQKLFEKKIWSIEDVSLFTGYAIGTIYNKTMKGEIPKRKRGNRLYFIPSEILDWIDGGNL